MTYVIGDIHGEYKKLLQIVKVIPEKAKLVFVGDYINKGRDSKKVVDYLIELKKRRKVVLLIGNHEFKLIKAWNGNVQAKEFLAEYGFKETLESYLEKKISIKRLKNILNEDIFKEVLKGHLKFFLGLKPFCEGKKYFVVHAGIPQDKLGRFRLGSLEEMVFLREKFLKTKKKFRNKTIIFGHTAFSNVIWDGYKLGIDTGAAYKSEVGYGTLTSVCCETMQCLDHRGNQYEPKLQDISKIRLRRGRLYE